MRKSYPAYKDSGIEWMEKIPEHWNNSKIKYVGKVICGGTPSTENNDYWNGNIPWLQSGKVQYNTIHIDNVDKYITEDALKNSSTKMVKKDSVLIAITGATCSNIGYLTFDSTINQSIVGIENSKEYLSWFIFYYLVSQKHQIISFQSGGAQGGVTKQEIKNLIIPELPISEQKRIVSYLDYKTKLIDDLIEKTSQKIELLKEKRTSLINHCVTKGLNPDVEMKDSGVEWIGEIPKHWVLTPIKHIVEKNKYAIKTGPFGSQLKSSDMSDKGIKIYNQRTVYDENFANGEIYISPEKYKTMKSFTVYSGDVLISSRGTIGKMAIVPDCAEIGILHPCLIRLRIDSNTLHKEYLWWYINHSSLFLESVKYESNATTIDVIYSNILAEIKIPLPPLFEQYQIVDFLDSQSQKIDTLIEKENKRIELLKEYRQSLISEAVTGKIDVRDEVIA